MADSGPQELELLFFDTFSHENTEELNLDLVQFPSPVVIREVRVIPLQTRVQADVPGGVRLGATNPSSFALELYANNLNRPNAATFEKLGSINYKENVDIKMKAEVELPTDGLILKGWYNTLTVAIYGSLTIVKPESSSPPPPPPPQPRPKQAVEVRASQPSDPPSRPEWEPPKQGTKPQQQHPLDYINQQVQLQQAAAQAHLHTHPPQAIVPPPHVPQATTVLPQGGPLPSKPNEMFPEPFDRSLHPPGQHRDILQDFIASPKIGHVEPREGNYDPRNDPRSDPRQGPNKESQFGSDGRKSFDDGEYRGREGSSRERDSGRDHELRAPVRESEREHKQKEWERFRERERERERSREKEREYIDSESRDYPRSPTRRRSWSRSQSRSRSRSYSPRRSNSRSPRGSVRSISRSRSPRSYSRSPKRRSRSPIRSRSMTPIRSRSPSYSRSPERQPITTTPMSPAQTPMSPRSRSHSRDHESPIRQIPRHPRDPSPQYFRDPSPTQEEIMEAGEVIDEVGEDALFDPLSPDGVGYSDQDELPEADRDYESISSGDELPNMDEMDPDLQDFEEIDETCTFTTVFNPFTMECLPLETFADICLTPFEQEKIKLQEDHNAKLESPPEAKAIMDVVEQFRQAEHHDKWVTALEELPDNFAKGLSWLIVKEGKQDVLKTLIDWTLEGVDLDKAMQQPENAFKIRHLKMGIKLAGSLCTCDSDICLKLMEVDIQNKLLDLMCSPFMSFSLKIQIVRALDCTTRLTEGIKGMLGTSVLHTDENKDSCFQRILSLMLEKQNVRVVVALTALVKKINMYEMMQKLSTDVSRIKAVSVKNPSQEPQKSDSLPEQSSGQLPEQELDGSTEENVVSEAEIDGILAYLHDLAKVLHIAPHIIGQPNRSLPGKSMFALQSPVVDPYPGLYHIAKSFGIVECLFHLLSNPSTFAHPQVFAAIKSCLQVMLRSSHGLRFLFSRRETTNGIIRCLIQEDLRDDAEESPIQHLGIEMAMYLQTLQHIDQLKAYQQKGELEQENIDIIPVLHSLYTMTFTPQGREAVIKVLCMDSNILTLLLFVEKTGEEEKDVKRKKSVSVAYSISLILTVIRHSSDMKVMEKFGPRLVALSNEDFSSKLLEMQEWLLPFKSLTDLTHDGVVAATGHMKQYTDDLQKVPRGLITTMRILKHIAIPPHNPYPEDVPDELKYRYALVEMYSQDGLSVCMTVLQKVAEILLRPWQRGIPQSSEQIAYHLAVVNPTLEIVKHMLCYLIKARGTEFRDLTSLPVLFELHTVLCSVPISSNHMEDLQQIQKMIMDTLMAYTQPLTSQAETDEGLSESLWTKTLKELLKYTTKAPYTYLSGLLIMSELLPVPLPVQTKEPLSEEETNVAVNNRKLWSVHLHCLSQQIQEMIRILATSTCQPLQVVLRRVCWQLSDLSAPSAILVTKCILDMVVESFQTLKRPQEKTEEGEQSEERVERIASPYASKMLNLLAYVLAQPSVKCATLHLMTNKGEDIDVKYEELLPQMLEILNSACDAVAHVNSQECIVSIIQSLCDPDVALVMGEHIPINEQIAHALPNGNYMTQITTSLLDHMGSPDHSYASILPCVRTLVMLTEHDYGFYYLKSVLEQKTTAIGRLMVRINTTFSKDSSDCLSTLSTLLEFLRLLMSVEMPSGAVVTVTRTSTLSQQELQEVLSWNPSMENHPLLDLEKLVEESAKDEETLESLLESMAGLMKMLREPNREEKKVLVEPLEIVETLSNLYSKRSVFVIADVEDERLNPEYWLSNPSTDMSDMDPDLTMADMEEMCRKHCPEFNLEEELKKTVVTSQAELTKPRRIKIGDRRKSQEISIYRGRGFKRPFVAPMRGRGIARGMMNNSGRMDSFRTRTPNTSRPPSMHVDDFMKLEKGQDERSPTAVSPIRRVDSLIQRDTRGRGGRGFDRGRGGNFFSNRGHSFFTPPGNYARRESNNIYVGGGGGSSVGGSSDRGRGGYRPQTFETPHTNFGRGSHPGSGERRGDFRFASRGRGSYHNKDGDQQAARFAGGGFRGRRDNLDRGRHARSFTK